MCTSRILIVKFKFAVHDVFAMLQCQYRICKYQYQVRKLGAWGMLCVLSMPCVDFPMASAVYAVC